MDYSKTMKLRFRAGGLDLPERRKRCTGGRREEEENAQVFHCGKAAESRTHIVGECEPYNEERDVLQEMRKMDECGMEKFGTLTITSKYFEVIDISEKVIPVLGDRWWPQTAKQDGE